MKIAVASDLHLEFGGLPKEMKFPEADMLVLAGDIVVAKHFDNYVADLKRLRDHYPFVLAIPGNHEFYGSEYFKTLQILEEKYSELDIKFMNDQVLTVAGVKQFTPTPGEVITIAAGVGWTDMNGANPITMIQAQQSINDFRRIQISDRRFTPEHAVVLNAKFREVVKGANIIVMHHLPTANCVPTKYRGFEHTNGAFKNDNFNLKGVKLVIHGHTHDTVDFMENETRIFANPRGYVGYEDTQNWEIKVVEYS